MKEGELRKEAGRLNDADRSFLQQKAKLNFNLQSDRGTKFYHSVIKGKQTRNFVAGLVLPDGSVTTSQDQVVSEFLAFYQSLLGTKKARTNICDEVMRQGPKLSPANSLEMIRPLEEVEVQMAIFGVGNGKSPGPDG